MAAIKEYDGICLLAARNTIIVRFDTEKYKVDGEEAGNHICLKRFRSGNVFWGDIRGLESGVIKFKNSMPEKGLESAVLERMVNNFIKEVILPTRVSLK